ncbi:MAG: hypothetical protein ACI85I_000722 [Arenicella sp.]|jgi:hypothetical protein
MKHFLLLSFLFACLFLGAPQISFAEPAGGGDPISLNGATLFDAYPNPASSYVTFSYNLTDSNKTAELEVFNVIGEVVSKVILDNQSTRKELSVSNLKKGIYFYRLAIDGHKSSIKKLIIR